MAIEQVHDLTGELVVLCLVRFSFRVTQSVEEIFLDDEMVHGVIHEGFQNVANLLIGGTSFHGVMQFVGGIHQPLVLLVDLPDSNLKFLTPRPERYRCASPEFLIFLCTANLHPMAVAAAVY
jgi:hypothetical protein